MDAAGSGTAGRAAMVDSRMSDPRHTPQEYGRKGQPDEDDNLISRIEVEFGIPTFLPQGFMRDLDDLLSAAVRLKRNQPSDGVHWVSGNGSKPIWSKADAAFLGKSVADDETGVGETQWDDSV